MIEIIMLSYNNGKTIRLAIQSVLSQKTDIPFMLSIYDNNSTDNTRQILGSIKDDRINLCINDGNIGYTSNFINSINRATGDYIAFLDADDYWTDDYKLQKQVNYLRANGCEVLHTSGEIKNQVPSLYTHTMVKAKDLSVKDIMKTNPIIWQTVMIKTTHIFDVSTALDGFAYKFNYEPIPCDIIVLLELCQYGIKSLPDNTATHIIHNGTVSHSIKPRNILKYMRATAYIRFYYARKYKIGLLNRVVLMFRIIKKCLNRLGITKVWK